MNIANRTTPPCNDGLTKKKTNESNAVTSLLCVSTPGRGAVSMEAAPAFFWRNVTRKGDALKMKHPAFAGCRGGFSTSAGTKKKGVFGVGALLPQFLAELTSTLNSQIWYYHSISARPWQA